MCHGILFTFEKVKTYTFQSFRKNAGCYNTICIRDAKKGSTSVFLRIFKYPDIWRSQFWNFHKLILARRRRKFSVSMLLKDSLWTFWSVFQMNCERKTQKSSRFSRVNTRTFYRPKSNTRKCPGKYPVKKTLVGTEYTIDRVTLHCTVDLVHKTWHGILHDFWVIRRIPFDNTTNYM